MGGVRSFAALQADNAQLHTVNADLKAANLRLEQKVKVLQVAVTVLLGGLGGMGVGLAACMAGASVQIALSSACAVLFGVIMASMAILGHMRR